MPVNNTPEAKADTAQETDLTPHKKAYDPEAIAAAIEKVRKAKKQRKKGG